MSPASRCLPIQSTLWIVLFPCQLCSGVCMQFHFQHKTPFIQLSSVYSTSTLLPCPGQTSIQFSIPREEQQYWRLFSERDVHPQLKLITFTHKLNNRGIPSSSRLIAVHANLLNPPIQQSQSARQIAIGNPILVYRNKSNNYYCIKLPELQRGRASFTCCCCFCYYCWCVVCNDLDPMNWVWRCRWCRSTQPADNDWVVSFGQILILWIWIQRLSLFLHLRRFVVERE